jgi:hypothetical protein
MSLRGIVVPMYYYRALACYEIATDQVIVRLDKTRHKLEVPRNVLASLDGVRTDKLVGFFDDFIGDVAPGQQRHIDFRVPHSPEDHAGPERINAYIDTMQAQRFGGGLVWSCPRGLRGLRHAEGPSE